MGAKERIDAERAWGHVRDLDYPRLADTPGEDRAREELVEKFRGLGLETRLHGFAYSTGAMVKFTPAAMFTLAGLLALCAWAYWARSRMLIAPTAALWVAFIALMRISESDWPLTLFKPDKVSWNIITRKRSERGRGRVVFMAHYDTKSQIMPVHIRVTLYVLGLALLIGLLIAYLVTAIRFLGAEPGPAAGQTLLALSGVAVGILTVLGVNPPLNRSAGAMDDASGLGVMLEMGRAVRDMKLGNVDVWLAATACEEVGLLGALNLCRDHEDELPRDKTWIVNLDMPCTAAGRISLNTSHGLPPKPTSRELNRLIADIAAEREIPLKRMPIPIGAAADHFPFLRAGYDATAFIAPSTVVHTSRDTADRVPARALAQVGEICLDLIERLDRDLD